MLNVSLWPGGGIVQFKYKGESAYTQGFHLEETHNNESLYT